MASRTCNARDASARRRALRVALILAAAGAPAIIAAQTPATARPGPTPAVTTARFSDLAELTPTNVRGLLPLVSQMHTLAPQDQPLPPGKPAPAPRLEIESSAGVDVRLQRFVDERAGQVRLTTQDHPLLRPIGGSPGCVVSYLVASAAAAGEGGSAPGGAPPRELRAWDPIERRVLWSVREALPISPTLLTAGGLLFYGTGDGWLKALDARTGRLLWEYRVDGRKLDGPRSFRGIGGHQYIAVRALPYAPGESSGTLLLFALAH